MNLTGIILTYNEAPNIARTLVKLNWLPRIILVDSFSDDDTESIANTFPNVEFIQRVFDNHTNQWNYALQETGIKTDWVLALDADYQIPEKLSDEIQSAILEKNNIAAYWMHFIYAIDGEHITSGIYPPVLALYQKEHAVYVDDGHTQKLHVDGKTQDLKHKAIHDDRKSMKRWLTSQWNYASLEAKKLLKTDFNALSRQDKIRLKRKFTPILVFFYCIFLRSGWKDGSNGFLYAWQRMIAETLLQYCLILERKNSGK